MLVGGVDGCRAGWVGVQFFDNDSHGKAQVFPHIQALWDAWHDATYILIDIPIGLKNDGATPRGCDVEARRILRRPRSSSIFPVPCRAAVYARTYLEACAINREKTTKSVSKQAWNIIPKILQVDSLLRNTPAARQVIRETHPELCFWGLAGGHAISHYKKTAAGLQERVILLEHLLPGAQQLVTDTLAKYSRNVLVIDDVVDALALAMTVMLAGNELESIPVKREWDGEGLPMEMVFLRLKI